MKTLLAICMMLVSAFVWAEGRATSSPVSGEVLETKDAAGYTYLLLKTKDGETWAAVGQAAVRKGDKVTVENVTVMNNFESRTLKMSFPRILFGTLRGAEVKPAMPAGGMTSSPHAGLGKMIDGGDIHVDKASGANARTVEEILLRPAELKDKPVAVRGKVVKYSAQIMGKNWIHLRDGTGSAAQNTHDLLVTTTDQAKLGDVVTVKGVVRTDRDFGSGYAYKLLIEDATLAP